MLKKIICILIVFSLSFMMAGCWDYTGLDDMAIVAGTAIDKNEETGGYQLTFEVLDVAGSKPDEVSAIEIVSNGMTIFDAIRNAKKRFMNRLYHANNQVVVISSKIAREDGIQPVMDLLLRGVEARETVYMIISQQDTASEIIIHEDEGATPKAYDIQDIIDKDQAVTGTTRKTPVYQAYNILKGQGQSLVLPAFHNVKNGEIDLPEVNGVAVFKMDKLVGFLSSEETKYYLFAVGEINGGILPYNVTENRQDFVSLEIFNNKTNITHSFVDNKLKMKITTETTALLVEASWFVDISKQETMDMIKASGEALLKKGITELIDKVQTEFNSDIFGFGSLIYRRDPLLWNQVSQNWDDWFPTIEIEVIPTLEIVNTGYLKSN